jgi:hypothetical protein
MPDSDQNRTFPYLESNVRSTERIKFTSIRMDRIRIYTNGRQRWTKLALGRWPGRGFFYRLMVIRVSYLFW